jgi:RHS repeat-associated protein
MQLKRSLAHLSGRVHKADSTVLSTRHRAGRRSAKCTHLGIEQLEERCLLAGDMTPPQIIGLEAFTDAKGKKIDTVVLTASEDMAVAAAETEANYAIRLPGKDKRLGTGDDASTAPATAVYDPALDRITLTLRTAVKIGTFFQVFASGAVGGLADTVGNLLDGDANGTVGGNYAVNLAIGTSVKYADGDGDQVSLRITGGDVLALNQRAGDPAPVLEILDRSPGSSTLTGSLKRNKRGGDGQATIAGITGAAVVSQLPLEIRVVPPDTTPPAAPTALRLTPATDSGSSMTDAMTNNTSPTVEGDAETGSVVRLFLNGTEVGQTTANSPWQIPVGPLAEGPQTFTATATDAAGNESAVSAPLVVTIDTTAPSVPSVPDLASASDSGSSRTDNTTNVTTPTFGGTADAGSEVELFDGAGSLGTTTAVGGNWNFTVPAGMALSGGSHSITAKAKDSAGNTSAVSAALTLMIDTTPPDQPLFDLDVASDTAPVGDHQTTLASVTLVGQTAANMQIELLPGTATTTSDVNGRFEFAGVPLADGANDFTVRATDPAGNQSTFQRTITRVQEMTPAPPSMPDLAPTSDSGSSDTDNETNDTTPTFTGTAEVGTDVEVFDGANSLGTTTTVGVDWSFTVPPASALGDGSHSITAKASNAAGTSGSSAALTIAIDTTPPDVPTFDLDPATDTAPTGDGVTEFDVVTLRGQTAAGMSVLLVETGATTTADTVGDFTIGNVPLELGDNSFTVRATDRAGNASSFMRQFTRLDPNAILLQERNNFVVQTTAQVELGQPAGTRTIRFDVVAEFDTTDQTAAIEDTLLVYLVDPSDPSQTLLDRGTPGTSLLLVAGDQVEFPPGLVRFDGTTASIDVTRLGGLTQGQLKFQLVNSDGDTGSRVRIANIVSTVDLGGVAGPGFPLDQTLAATGAALDVSTFTEAAGMEVTVSNVRVGSPYTAEISLQNGGAAIGRNVAIVFPGLPVGVTLQGASGVDSSGSPYINVRAAIPPGGLGTNATSLPVQVTFDNPGNIRFALRPTVLTAGPNRAPIFDPIGPLSVMPGGHLEVPLVATDPDGDRVTFSIRLGGTGSASATPELPTGMLRADGTMEFMPAPDEIGQYTFDVLATDGAATTSQTVTLDVVADTTTTTRVSGFILDVDQSPLAGMQVEIGAVQGLTQSDGSFTLDLGSGPVVSDTLKVRGEAFGGPNVYPFIAEKLAFILEHEVFTGVNNVIDRPIFLPPLDVAGGTTIDPMQDTMVQQEVAPGEMVEVFVAAGTLMNQQGTPFTGTLSITEVPANLTPAALPDNLFPDLVVTIQPGEMVFASPAPLTFPNRSGWAPGTIMDLWSINPVTGEFDDVGDMEVSADGTTIDTISGGVRNSSWHLPAPPPPKVKTPTRRHPKNQKHDLNEFPKCVRATSMCELHSGAILETHDMVSYQSLGIDRGLSLVYDSLRADPRPIVHFSVNINDTQLDPAIRLVADMTLRRGAFQFQVPGHPGEEFGLAGGEHIWTLPGEIGETGGAFQVDLRDQPSGQFNYTVNPGLRRFTGTTSTGSSRPDPGAILHVNSIASPFGSGWGLAGLHQLVENPDGTVLLIDGDGSELLFGAPPSAGQPFVAPPGDFSTLVRLPSGDFRRTTKDQTVYTFDSGNRLATVADRNGNTTRFDYDAGGRLIKITDPVGLETSFGIGANGRVSSITDPASRVTRFEYDAAGNLTRITDPDDTRRTFVYDSGHHMTGETDQRGNRESLKYDAFGRVVEAVRKDGTVLQYQPVQVQGLLRPEATIDPLAPPPTIRQTLANALSADANGNVTRTELDQAGQLIAAVDAVGPMGTTRRDARNLATTEVNSRGNPTAVRYDSRGNLLNIRDSITGPSVYVFNSGDVEMENIQKVLDALVATGFQPVTGSCFCASELPSFDAFLFLMQDDRRDLGDFGGSILRDYVNAGGALVIGEPLVEAISFRNPTTLAEIIPATYEEFEFGGPTYTLTTNDPVLAAGLPTQFSFNGNDARLLPKAGATQFFASDSGGAGVVGWDVGDGRVLSLSSGIVTRDFPEIDDPIYQQLLGNAIEWAIKNPVKSYATFTYDPNFNQLTGLTDADGRQTLSDIDPANGNMRSFTRVSAVGDNEVAAYTYTSQGLLDTIIDPLGRVTDYDYDARGRLVTATVAKGTADEGVMRYEYDAAGNLTATIDELGRRTELAYDAMNRVVRATEADPDGAGPLTSPVNTFTYDAVGNALTVTDARDNTTRFTYDALNRVTRRTDPLAGVETLQYDSQGNVVAQTDELGHVTRFRYDARNRVVEFTDPDGGTSRFGYDADDNRTSVTDPNGNTTTFAFDARSRLMQETDPLGMSTVYEYDEADNLFLITDRLGRSVRFFFDGLNRLANEAWFSESGIENVLHRTYDKAGNLLSVEDGFVNGAFTRMLAYTYDNRNRVTSVDNLSADGSPNVVLGYTYDAVGNVLSVAETINGTPGAVTSYAYDALNRIVRETQSGGGTNDKRVDLAYNPLGQLTAIDRFSDLAGAQSVIRTEHTHDELNRLTHIDHKRGMSVVAFEDLAYDAASRITQSTDGDGSSSYSYDNRDQIRSADHSRAALVDEAFAYDANGNRTSSNRHGSAYQTGPGNRLLSDGTFNYAYDAEGNLIRRTEIVTGRVREFQYDNRNRLVAVLDNDAAGVLVQRTDYRYDVFNRRISRSVDNTPGDAVEPSVDHFIYDREDVLLEFLDPDGSGPQPSTLNSRLLHGPAVDQVLAQDDGAGGVQWYLTDHLGTTRDLVDNSGSVVNHFVYDSYGNVISQNAAGPTTRYLFTGREFDTSVGLYYYRARYYDAAIGRFLREDPLRFGTGDANLYRYVRNNLLGATDPMGLCENDEHLVFEPDLFWDALDPNRPIIKKGDDQMELHIINNDRLHYGRAVIKSIKGDAEILRDGKVYPANVGDQLDPLDRIVTGVDSFVALGNDDESPVFVNELSDVKVNDFYTGGDVRTRLWQKAGEISAEIRMSRRQTRSDFGIKRPMDGSPGG